MLQAFCSMNSISRPHIHSGHTFTWGEAASANLFVQLCVSWTKHLLLPAIFSLSCSSKRDCRATVGRLLRSRAELTQGWGRTERRLRVGQLGFKSVTLIAPSLSFLHFPPLSFPPKMSPFGSIWIPTAPRLRVKNSVWNSFSSNLKNRQAIVMLEIRWSHLSQSLQFCHSSSIFNQDLVPLCWRLILCLFFNTWCILPPNQCSALW